MKILWHSNAPWAATGYGQQTLHFAPRIKALGHDVAVSAFYGLQGGLQTWQGITIYPGGNEGYGNDVLKHHAAAHFGEEPGIMMILADAWVMQPGAIAGFPTFIWTPVDHDPMQPPSVRMLHQSQAQPVAMSRHGERMLRDQGFEPIYVPHGIDTGLLHPGDKAEARQKMGLPGDAFVVGIVAANKGTSPIRKAWPQMLEAFARFQRLHTDALVYIHSDGQGIYNGMNLFEFLEVLDVPKHSVRFANQYRYHQGFPPSDMAALYQSFDVLLNPSMGEGFGVPIVEAQACGVPVIVTDWTAMPELVGAGWKVGGEKTWTPLGSWMLTPHTHEIVDALDRAYRKRGDERLAQQAVDFASQYDADLIISTYWKPLLEEVQGSLTGTARVPAGALSP